MIFETATRKILHRCLLFLRAIVFAFVVCFVFVVLCNPHLPAVAVVSGHSLYAGFERGDLLFITNSPSQPYNVGDMAMFNIPGIEIPTVHRIIETRSVPSTYDPDDQMMRTKADDNYADDVGLYGGMEFITRRSMIGKVRGFIPYIGYPIVIVSERPHIIYIWYGVTGAIILLTNTLRVAIVFSFGVYYIPFLLSFIRLVV